MPKNLEFPIPGSYLDNLMKNKVVMVGLVDHMNRENTIKLPDNLSEVEQKKLYDLIYFKLVEGMRYLRKPSKQRPEFLVFFNQGDLVIQLLEVSQKIRDIYVDSNNTIPPKLEDLLLAIHSFESLQKISSVCQKLEDMEATLHIHSNEWVTDEAIKKFPELFDKILLSIEELRQIIPGTLKLRSKLEQIISRYRKEINSAVNLVAELTAPVADNNPISPENKQNHKIVASKLMSMVGEILMILE